MLIYAHIKAKKQQQLDQLSVVYKLMIAWLICNSYHNSRFLY